jgi:hypothetical protein
VQVQRVADLFCPQATGYTGGADSSSQVRTEVDMLAWVSASVDATVVMLIATCADCVAVCCRFL